MLKLELMAAFALAAIFFGLPGGAFGYETLLRSQNPNEITLTARAPENGNWSMTTIRVKQGEKIKLRLTSDDVVHGLAIPGLGVDVPEIYPGKFTTVEFVADTPGTYPFVCTALCSPQHGHMRGQIIVEGVTGLGGAADASVQAPESDVTGKQAFETDCVACHGMSGAGGLKMGKVKAADLRRSHLEPLYHGDDALLRRAIVEGKDQKGNELDEAMPRWAGKLTEVDLDDIIKYIKALR